MLRSEPGGDQKEGLARQRSRTSTGSVAGEEMALMTSCKRPGNRAGGGELWLEIRKPEAGLSHPPPWAQHIGPGANT